jgi:group I intron endonuclease
MVERQSEKETRMATKISGIYVITNTITGDRYVGQSINLLGRRAGHFRLLFKGQHTNRSLQDDFSRYGSKAFVWRPLELCPVESLCAREVHYTNELGATYNLSSPPKRIRRDSPRLNPTLQELRRWKAKVARNATMQ